MRPLQKRRRDYFVYLVHNPDAKRHTHKIGCAVDVDERHAVITTIAPSAVVIGIKEGGLSEERRLHRQLAHLNTGGEWFALDDAAIATLGFEEPAAFYSSRPGMSRGQLAAQRAAQKREYYMRPDVKEHRRTALRAKYASDDEFRERVKTYLQRPDIRAKRLERSRKRWREKGADEQRAERVRKREIKAVATAFAYKLAGIDPANGRG